MYIYFLILFIFIAPVNASSHHPQVFLKTVSGTQNEGLDIYNHFCVNCHAEKPIIPLGAPRFNVEKDWENRLKQPLEIFFQHIDEGLNAMPPRGGCFECSDYQLILAIVTMVPKKSQKALFNKLLEHKKSK